MPSFRELALDRVAEVRSSASSPSASAQIGYAGSDLVKIELGVIVELPDPKILILGVVRVAAPDKDRDALKGR